MNIEKTLFDKAINAIDNVNVMDPFAVVIGGESIPKELLYSVRMSDMLSGFKKDADHDIQIACRAQHIARWKYPRSTYPAGRAGYLQWRKELYGIHAQTTVDLLSEIGAPEEFLNSVKQIMEEKVEGSCEGSQVLEDVACLTFLQHYFEEFMQNHDEEKLISIVKKTWGKMSEDAHEETKKINFTPEAQEILVKALEL